MEMFLPALLLIAILIIIKLVSKINDLKWSNSTLKEQCFNLSTNNTKLTEKALAEQQTMLEAKYRSALEEQRKKVEKQSAEEIRNLTNRIKNCQREITSLRKNQDALTQQINSQIDENNRLSTLIVKSDEKTKSVQQSSSNMVERTKIQSLEKKLSRIKDFCPSFDELFSSEITPAEYELVLIDRIPLYSSAGEVNNTPIAKAEAPSSAFSFSCETVRSLYQHGKQKKRLETALSENINSRFLSPIAVDLQDPLSVSVLIDPNRRSGKKSEVYVTTLSQCSCYDFRNTLKGRAACKHMFALALSLNLINKNGDFVNHVPF